MSNAFSDQILSEKLSKVNTTQQCIETLSQWCIFHRTKAEQIVTTWDKQFHNGEMVKKVPLLYLANDILQNSKRNGNEFVTEFWKILPLVVKQVHLNGDERAKKALSRVIEIWEERKVFGSHEKPLKDIMLSEEPPGPLDLSKKRSHSVRIMKRDSRSIRTKLTVGATAEKVVSAYHLVVNEIQNEDEEMSKCKTVINRVKKMEKNVEAALKKVKDQNRKDLAKELENEENMLKQCIDKLKGVEANRVALVSQLREALHEQESELENVRTQMQVAQAQIEEAEKMRKKLEDENYVKNTNSATKETALAIADKLAASSSSQYIMAAVLSSFAAEAAANNATNGGGGGGGVVVPPQSTPPNISYPVNSQPHYHMVANPTPNPNQQVSYHYGGGQLLPPGPPPQPPLSATSYMVPMSQQQQQQMHMNMNMTMTQQQQVGPTPPGFQHGVVYYPNTHQQP